MIDSSLDYFENKQSIEAEAHRRLFLRPEREGEVEAEEMARIARTAREIEEGEG